MVDPLAEVGKLRRAVGGRCRRLGEVVFAALVVGLMVAGPGVDGVRAETYTVQPGDTLSEIARDHGVTMTELMEANGLTDPHRIQEGETLQLGATAPPATTHVVQPGDVLGIIARDHGVSVAALMAANGITDPHRIVAGSTLVVPSGGATATASTPAAPAPAATYDLPERVLEDPDRLALVPVFEHWAAANGLEPELLMAVAWQESGWSTDAVSSVGAYGVGQLMPGTAAWVAGTLIGEPDLDPADPADNIRMSARYLRWLEGYMGSTELALAGYFEGPNAVRLRLAEGVEREGTDHYVDNVLALRDRFE